MSESESSTSSGTSGSVLYFKIGCMVGAILFSLLAFIPSHVRVSSPQKRKAVASHFSSFAGGVFLAIGLQGMLHDGVEDTEGLDTEYPLPFALAGIGYLIVYSAEQVFVPWAVRKLYASKIAQDHIVEAKPTNGGEANDDDVSSPVTNERPVAESKKGSIGGLPSSATDVDAINVIQEGQVIVAVDDAAQRMDSTEDKDSSTISVSTVDNSQANILALTLVTCLCLHEFFEGLALGSLTSYGNLYGTILAIFSHKAVEALATGTAVAAASFSRCFKYTILTIYAFSLTIGIAIGLAVVEAAENSETAVGILMSFSAGTFLYIAGVELRNLDKHVWSRLFLVLLGYTIVSLTNISDVS